MAPSDYVGESWPNLCARIDAERVLQRWASVEPALAAFTELAAVAVDVHSSRDRAHVDDVFAALLRLAAADNGDDQDAAIVVAHLMHKGSRAVAISLADLSRDIDAVVATELWMQIRGYRWRHRHHSHALGLKNDTRAAVLREFAPARDGEGRRRQVPLSPEVVTWLSDAQVDETVEAETHLRREAEDELLDVLSWATGTGVLSEDDVRLLLEFELAKLPGRRAKAAAAWGLSERHIRRRCSQVKQRLHDARMAYLDYAA